jgi:hypothetical protein
MWRFKLSPKFFKLILNVAVKIVAKVFEFKIECDGLKFSPKCFEFEIELREVL